MDVYGTRFCCFQTLPIVVGGTFIVLCPRFVSHPNFVPFCTRYSIPIDRCRNPGRCYGNNRYIRRVRQESEVLGIAFAPGCILTIQVKRTHTIPVGAVFFWQSPCCCFLRKDANWTPTAFVHRIGHFIGSYAARDKDGCFVMRFGGLIGNVAAFICRFGLSVQVNIIGVCQCFRIEPLQPIERGHSRLRCACRK